MAVKTTKLVVSDDIETDTDKTDTDKSSGYAMATVMVDRSANGEPITVATSINAADKAGKCERSVISIEPSVLQMVTVGEERDPNAREAQLCCGCCCDLVRACIIVNILYLCYSVFFIFASWWGLAWIQGIELSNRDDDVGYDIMAELAESDGYLIVVIIQLTTGMLFASIGIIGSSRFIKAPVLACAIWYCIDLAVSGYQRVWPSVLMKGFFAYPHFALFVALKNGKITRENYMVERHCCCDAKDYSEQQERL